MTNMEKFKKNAKVRVTTLKGNQHGQEGTVKELAVSIANGLTAVLVDFGDRKVWFSPDDLEVVFKRGDVVKVVYGSGLYGSGSPEEMEGTVTGPEEQGLIAVDLGDEGEIVFSPDSVIVVDPAPEGKTERVTVTLEGSEDNTSTSDVWSAEETEVIIKLARKLNEDAQVGLQPRMEVTVNGEKIVRWDD